MGKADHPAEEVMDSFSSCVDIHRDRNIKGNLSLLFWALLVGAVAGFVGGVFRLCLTRMADVRHVLLTWGQSFQGWGWIVPVVFCVVLVSGALFLVRRFAPETSGSGVQEIEGALEGVRPARWRRVLPVKFFAGLMSLSAGLVLGREGPTIQMGGSVGRMIGDLFRISGEKANILMACGAGAGLSAAFNAPLAGVLFIIEEMRSQFRYNVVSVQCVFIASAVADIVVRFLTGQGPVIDMTHLQPPHLTAMWIFLVFGMIFGGLGLLFNLALVGTLNLFSRARGWPHRLMGLFVGTGIGLLIWTCPDATGGGYEVIPRALHQSLPVAALILIFVARFGTTVFSYASGVPGGIFAPMMALGTLFGMWFGHFAHTWLPHLVIHPSVFAVAGMGALFAATVRAPLTGIALAVEMTGNYILILPLILTCMAATVVAEAFGGKPIYSVLLQRTLQQEGKPSGPS